MLVDTNFDVYSDTPANRDPDSDSPTLRKYHQLLWSKRLPDGTQFSLSTEHPGAYLFHRSGKGEFLLSSDSIGHTYRYWKSMAPIIEKISGKDLDRFFSICSTVGAYVIFPSQTINRKPTINGARGMNHKIKDRFDLTLECIRRHYEEQESPLSEVLARYSDFFDLFESFRGYVEYFLFQDLVSGNAGSINFFIPFSEFESSAVPVNVDEYRSYQEGVVRFVRARNVRIAGQLN